MKIENLSIGIVCGGFSNEREISLRGAQSIHQTLIAKNINSKLIDIRDKKEKHDKKMYDGIDFALVMIHGKGGEDGEVQEFLSSLNIKFSGSDISGLKNSYDKVLTKQIWRENKINTPQYVSDIFDWSDLPDFLKKTSKLVIKPSKEGSSLGVSIIKNNSKKLQIQLDLNTLDEHRVSEISEIVNKHKGEKTLTIQVFHEKEKVNLPLVSRKYKIDVSKDLLNKLDSVDLPYLIN